MKDLAPFLLIAALAYLGWDKIKALNSEVSDLKTKSDALTSQLAAQTAVEDEDEE